jgi:hypothetical protein
VSKDVLNMIFPDWVLEPFSNLQTAELSLQEDLLELSTNEELKLKLKNGYQEFWLQSQIPVLYLALWAATKKFFIAFPSYLVERGESHNFNRYIYVQQIPRAPSYSSLT